MAKQTLEQLLERVDKQVKAKIEKILANLTPEQRLAIIDNPAIIDDLLKDIDVDKLAKYYFVEFSKIAGTIIKDYSFEIAEAQKQKVNIFVNKLLELKTDTLRQFIESNKAQFKNKIIELIINGSDRKVIKEYFAKTPFTNAQIGTLINTAESDIRRTTVLSAYEDREGMRFRYEGGLIPTSSDNCTWLIKNQRGTKSGGIIAFHGTVKSFDKFDETKRTIQQGESSPLGFFFTKDMREAEIYAREAAYTQGVEGNGVVMKVTLLYNNPKYLGEMESTANAERVKLAKEEGYDAVIDDSGNIVVFNSSQIIVEKDDNKEEGYTLEEIQAGIETPYGIVDWGGRVPNYNCIHRWEPILNGK